MLSIQNTIDASDSSDNKQSQLPNKFTKRIVDLINQKYKQDTNQTKYIEVNDYGIFFQKQSKLFRVTYIIDPIINSKKALKKESHQFINSLKSQEITSLKSIEYFLPELDEDSNEDLDDYEVYVLEVEDEQSIIPSTFSLHNFYK